MMAMVLFLLPCLLSTVYAMRENRHDLERREGRIGLGLFTKCRSAKCNDQTFEFPGDLGGTLAIKDCQVKKNQPFEGSDHHRMCEETCTVSLTNNESMTVKVWRKSGHGLQECELQKGGHYDLCRLAKCNDQTFELSGDGGTFAFKDCQLNQSKENQPIERLNGEAMCVETCTVLDSNEKSQTVQVRRQSGRRVKTCQLMGHDLCEDTCCVSKCGRSGQSKFQDCELKGPVTIGIRDFCVEKCKAASSGSGSVDVLRPSGGQAFCELQAMDFVEQLEKDALSISDGQYGQLPLMKAVKVIFFLRKVKEDVLGPEFQAAEGHRTSREISTEVKHVAIIGDLHGQLFNLIAHLIRIKETYKDKGFIPLDGSSLLFCDPRMQYIFLGDYLDRGERGIELLLLLLAYKARCPKGLILLRGNHEDPDVWDDYGFGGELQHKFPYGHLFIRQEVSTLVSLLPYVAVVPGNFMAMHGGITPAFVKACTGKAGRFGKCLDRYIADMSAWADPHKGNGWIPSHRGEYIYEFGMDEAKAFLQSNGLKGIFRGHEQVETGHTSMVYDGYYVTTVFSAADYVDTFCRGQEPPWMFGAAGEGNSGAFVLVDLTDGTVTHQAMSGSKTRALAAQFTGAKCHGSWLETGSHQSRSIESFMQENHKRLAHGNTSCTLDQTEVDSFKEEVRKILSTSKDQASQEFEARKLIDLQGEALTHGESIEICRSMKKDHITLEVYNELRGTDEEILENDIKVREIELEESDVDT